MSDTVIPPDARNALVRTSKDIKADLLHRAIHGQSKYSSTEMILLIQWICSRSQTMPETHQKTLQGIDSTQPRSVMMLNAVAELLGHSCRYTETTGRNFIMPDSTTLQ
jgi:hypothetical protein